MTNHKDTTRKSGFVASRPALATAEQWADMETRFLLHAHKHHDLEAYWQLHDRMLSTPAPHWQAAAFKVALLSRLSGQAIDPTSAAERASRAATHPIATAVVRLYDAIAAVPSGGTVGAADAAIGEAAEAFGVLDPRDRANVPRIASAASSPRGGAESLPEINKALLAIHFDITALAKSPSIPHPPSDPRPLSELLAESRRLRDAAEDMPFDDSAEEGWTGAATARQADFLELRVDLAPCRSRDDAAAKVGAVLDAIMRKDGDLQDAAGSEAESLRSVLAFLQSGPATGDSPEIAAVADAHRTLYAAGDQPDNAISQAAADAARAAEARLLATRATTLDEVIFKLRCGLTASEPDFTDEAFPAAADLTAVYAPWAASESADPATRFVASAILDLAALAHPPTGGGTDLLKLRQRVDDIAASVASDAAVDEAAAQLDRAMASARALPCTSPDVAAAKLAYALNVIGPTGGDDERAIRDVIAYLEACDPSKPSPLAHSLAEYRRLWAENNAKDQDDPDLIKEAMTHFRSVVEARCTSAADALVKLDMAAERFAECVDGGDDCPTVNSWALNLAADAFAALRTFRLSGGVPGFDPVAAVAYLRALGCIVKPPFYLSPKGMKAEAMAFVGGLSEVQVSALHEAAATEDAELVQLAAQFQALASEFVALDLHAPRPLSADTSARLDAITAAQDPILQRMFALPATSLRGLWAKALIVEEFAPSRDMTERDDLEWRAVWSLVADAIGLGEQPGDPISVERAALAELAAAEAGLNSGADQ